MPDWYGTTYSIPVGRVAGLATEPEAQELLELIEGKN